jgi:regulator of protease activity HflC (stomatin/prohibitin superfamily)
MGDLVVWIAIVAMVIIVLTRSVVIIPVAKVGLVERLGRYVRTLLPGISVVAPFVNKVELTKPLDLPPVPPREEPWTLS